MQLKPLMDCKLGVVALLLFASVGTAQGKFVPDVDDYFKPCEDGKPLPGVDLTGIETLQDGDGKSLLNGKLIFNKSYSSPVQLKIYSERFKQGSWTAGEISRDLPDWCPLLLNPAEPWYMVTSIMEQQKCPYEAGHVENFNMATLGDVGVDIPEHFQGDWKMYIEVSTIRAVEMFTECLMIAFTIKEI